MKYLFINAVCGIRSTGRICTDLAKQVEKEGHEVKIAYGRATVPKQYERYAIRIGNNIDVCFHTLMSRYFYDRGYWSRTATKKFLKWADEYDPDILWIHNIHDYFINIVMLFSWIKSKPEMKVYWTQHDCWAFTGQCCYFSYCGCEEWKHSCNRCPQFHNRAVPRLSQRISKSYEIKKKLFTGIREMTLITPSVWLADLLQMSFMKEYKIVVKRNTIDSSVFKPTSSDFRIKNNLNNKVIILGVASPWSERKGLRDFLKLASLLSDEYVVLLVGVSEKQRRHFPSNVMGLLRTDSAKQLAEIYTASDIFLNMTYEDNYPTTNLEAQACGTPAITYRAGGSPESVPKRNVCEQGDIKAVYEKIINHDYDDAISLLT